MACIYFKNFLYVRTLLRNTCLTLLFLNNDRFRGSCKVRSERFCVPFTQFPPVLTAYIKLQHRIKTKKLALVQCSHVCSGSLIFITCVGFCNRHTRYHRDLPGAASLLSHACPRPHKPLVCSPSP